MSLTSKQRILVVDDEPQVLVALEDLLGDRFSVFTSSTADEALSLMHRERDIAVVITDQRMPRMNGDELLAQMSVWPDTQRILLTGYADVSAIVRAVNEGRIFSYVTKPWVPEDLRLKVHTAVEHFRLARELTSEKQLLHDLMDNTPDGIYFKDPDLRFRRANRAFATMVGVPDPGSVVGLRLEELSGSSAFGNESDEDEERVVAERQPVVDRIRKYFRRGEERWLAETKAPIVGQSGEVIGLVGIARDVTARVTAEDALRAGEIRLREQSRVLNSILDGMGDGVIAADAEGRPLLFNLRAQQLLGPSPEGVSLLDWTERYGVCEDEGGALLSSEQDPLLRAMQGNVVPEMEVVVDHESGAKETLAVTATPLIDDQRRIAGGIVLLRDVTKQKNLERQLLQSQKMEAMGRMAGGIAHDFNNLLAVIMCYGELTMEALDPGSPSRPDVRELLAAAERAAGLTRQLLSFSRRRVVHAEVLQLNDVVSDVEKMLRRILGEDIRLVTQMSPSLARVRADASQLEQIILNLTVNARDAMPNGGKLTIETQNVILTEEFTATHSRVEPGDFVMLAVTDTGAGMDARTRERIFEPFFTTKEVGKGTGLGLSTVYGIVEQSKGHIWVYSEVGHGTSFKIYLPQADSGEKTLSRLTQRPPLATGSGTILVVEDDDAVRRIAVRILLNCGYKVLEAQRAADARELCREAGSTIDLLLTDVVMPDISGFKLAEELTSEHPRMRVLHMSGYPGAAVVHEGLLAEGTPYVEKPFSPSSLADRVRAALTS